MKLFIVGHGRHGKDTVAEFISDNYGLTFESSSMFCAERVVRPWLWDLGIVYATLEQCYADRHNHRMHWYNAITAYNAHDPARLSREIFRDFDMYVGIRNRDEFIAARELADLSIWVEASVRVSSYDPTCKILREDCDIILDNNGEKTDHERKLKRLFDLFISKNIDRRI